MINIQTPAYLRKAAAKLKATRLLFSGGIPPVQALVAKVSQVLLPSSDPSRPTSTPIELRPGDLINESEITGVALALREDTDTLTEWTTHALSLLETEFNKREVRRKTLERRIFQLKSRANGLSQYTLTGSSKGAGSSSALIDFTDLKLIDFSRTTADIVPAGGPTGDGEATLARNPLRSRALNNADLTVISIDSPNGTKQLGEPGNILSENSSSPYQLILPGKAEGQVLIVLQLNKQKLPVYIAGVEVEGINQANISVELSLNNTSWETVAMGVLTPLGRTVLRFSRQECVYVRISLSLPTESVQDSGETIGLRKIKIFDAFYTDSSLFVSTQLLSEAAPLQGAKINVSADVPSGASLDVEVSFTGPDEGYIKTQRVTGEAGGTTFTVWNPSVTQEEVNYFSSSINAPFDNSRFWELPASSEQVVLWDSELFTGIDQWFVEGRPTSNAALDYPYKIPSLDTWGPAAYDRYDSGAIFPTAIYASISGDVSDIDFSGPALSITQVNGFLFTNEHSYGLEETTKSMVIMGYDGINGYLQPGWEYRLSTWIHCQEETAIKLSSMVPGGEWAGGTICYSYNINGKSVLSVGENQVEGLAGWLAFQANTSFAAGWNKIEILIHRPAQTNELNPTAFSCLRFSFDPLSNESRRLYSISQMRFRQEALTRVSEFNLRVLRNPGNRAAWAWRDGVDFPDRILGSDWGHDPSKVIFDSISYGAGANFRSTARLGKPESAPGCWIRAYLRGSELLPPRIKSIRADAE